MGLGTQRSSRGSRVGREDGRATATAGAGPRNQATTALNQDIIGFSLEAILTSIFPRRMLPRASTETPDRFIPHSFRLRPPAFVSGSAGVRSGLLDWLRDGNSGKPEADVGGLVRRLAPVAQRRLAVSAPEVPAAAP